MHKIVGSKALLDPALEKVGGPLDPMLPRSTIGGWDRWDAS